MSVNPQNDCPLPVGTMGTNELGEILQAIAFHFRAIAPFIATKKALAKTTRALMHR
ncbi:MAG: hypothetical protein F6K04_01270 [Leptolyngbya sp. SIO4C5]|nr:hypothetical protein [Leptolyngbya sp. SIO4C5]